jgi:hypothetical protein
VRGIVIAAAILGLVVRRRSCAVSNHKSEYSSFETRRKRRSSE